jgi:hypothetical protein
LSCRSVRVRSFDRAGKRIGHDQRRRGEVVGLHVRRDAAFEVAVAGQHAGGDQALVVDGLGDRRRQRAGVADAGGAAEADEVEAERIEVVCRPDFSRYSATTWLPGASEVFTQGLVLRPLATALRARRPAPISTLGFEVLVQDVMAAMATSPWPRS